MAEKHNFDPQAFRDGNVEMFRSIIMAGQSAMKSALLLNGIAAVTLLPFISSLLTQNTQQLVSDFATCLLLFAAGALAATVAFGITYVVQVLYYRYYSSKNHATSILWGHRLNIFTAVLVFVSYLLFFLGLWHFTSTLT